MKILNKIDLRLILENKKHCQMYWCIPVPCDNGFSWELEKFDNYDEMNNWPVVIHKLKHLWNKDINSCLDKCYALPRCVIYNNKLFHGNNLPVDFNIITPDVGKIIPTFNKKFIIKKDDLSELEKCLDIDLNLEYTEL